MSTVDIRELARQIVRDHEEPPRSADDVRLRKGRIRGYALHLARAILGNDPYKAGLIRAAEIAKEMSLNLKMGEPPVILSETYIERILKEADHETTQ